ncbi:MAG: hypothetical protein KGH71_00015 [Candidatus Micrarchaeota archaeon]|nr:hypothetical protein [Candidatus Micrarchaeota archaeon]
MRPYLLLIGFLLLFSTNLIFAQSASGAFASAANSVSGVNSSSSAPGSNLTLNCSFALTLNSQPAYQKLQNITIFYTLRELVPSCVIPMMNGSVVITQIPSSNVIFLGNLSVGEINSTPKVLFFSFNTLNFTNSTYSARLAFAFNGFSNSTSKSFRVINPQQLGIFGLSDQFFIEQGSPIRLHFNATNIGELSSGNYSLFLNITRFSSANSIDSSFQGLPLLPSQSAYYTLTVPNATQELGGYSVNVFAAYSVGNTTQISNLASTRYSVVAQTGFGGITYRNVSNYITSLPSLQITTAPLRSSLEQNSSTLLILGMQNIGSSPETVHLSFPSIYRGFLSLSTNVLSIQPHQQPSVQLLVTPNALVPSGTYLVPLTVNVNQSGVYETQTEYFAFSIYSPQPGIGVYNQITLTNNTNTSRGILQITNPTSDQFNNLSLHTLIPLAAARSASDIVTTGLPATTIAQPEGYVINWQIPQINPSSTIYAYYIITNPQNQQLLQQIQSLLSTTSSPPQSSVLKVVNIAFPTFYTNSSDNIQIFALYTGTTPQPVTFTLTAPSGITVANYTQTIEAQPNQLLSPTFHVTTGPNQGTYLLSLFINTKGFSANYTLPQIVLSRTGSGGANPVVVPGGLPFFYVQLFGFKVPAIVPILIIAVIAYVLLNIRKYLSQPRYKRETSEQLVRIREQIKRSEDE